MSTLAETIAAATTACTALMAGARVCIAAREYAVAVGLIEQAQIKANESRNFAVADELFNMYVEMKVLAFG